MWNGNYDLEMQALNHFKNVQVLKSNSYSVTLQTRETNKNKDPKTKTLLFSDSLDFERADKLFRYFNPRTNVAFGIGTYIANDTKVEPLNIVMKTTFCNGQDVAKISDVEGKGMCKNEEYVDYLKRTIQWRIDHEQTKKGV